MKRMLGVVLVSLAMVGMGCLPAVPSSGRKGPVRKVLILGDSMSWGLFGTSPTMGADITQKLGATRISVNMIGGAGATLETPWPNQPSFESQLTFAILAQDPDVVVIQSVLYPGSSDPANHPRYRAAVKRIFDIAQSRGAHVYIVRHHKSLEANVRRDAEVAERIQAEVAAGRGISTIPMDWWIDHCEKPFIFDGWHLNGSGVRCWADAVNSAVNQLRNDVG